MRLQKTQAGRDALQRRDRSLHPRERQILVITNGSQTRAQMLDLLGADAEALVEHLLQLGLLEVQSVVAPAIYPLPQRSAHVIPITQASSAGSQPSVAPAHKRSLAATKMYCIDVLLLLREIDAYVAVRAIQDSSSEADLIEHIAAAVCFVREKTSVSYALKILNRMQEIVPEGHAATLQRLRREMDVVLDVA